MRTLSAALLPLITVLCGLPAVTAGPDSADVDSIAACRTTDISVRLPPSLNSHRKNVSTYKPMPPGWYYGNWKTTYSSQPVYFSLQNMQGDVSPLFPQSDSLPGQHNDLTSYQLPNSTTLHAAYGVDTPRRSNDKALGPEWDDVYDFVGAGSLSTVNNSIEMLAWGYDTIGVPYVVIYETAVAATAAPPCIDIESRSDTGPTNATLREIADALLALHNAEITELVHQTVSLIQNGGRRGMGPFVCDAACINNTNTAP